MSIGVGAEANPGRFPSLPIRFPYSISYQEEWTGGRAQPVGL